jgi:type IV secretion system protein VirB2
LAVLAALLAGFPGLVLAASPFEAGANGSKVALLAILGPIAGIGVMASGIGALFGRISWLWFVGAVLGTILIFGSDQIVGWIRGLAGV